MPDEPTSNEQPPAEEPVTAESLNEFRMNETFQELADIATAIRNGIITLSAAMVGENIIDDTETVATMRGLHTALMNTEHVESALLDPPWTEERLAAALGRSKHGDQEGSK